MAALDNIMTHLRTKLLCSPVEDPIRFLLTCPYQSYFNNFKSSQMSFAWTLRSPTKGWHWRPSNRSWPALWVSIHELCQSSSVSWPTRHITWVQTGCWKTQIHLPSTLVNNNAASFSCISLLVSLHSGTSTGAALPASGSLKLHNGEVEEPGGKYSHNKSTWNMTTKWQAPEHPPRSPAAESRLKRV